MAILSSVSTNSEKARFDASRVVPTANENRPKSVAWQYYIQAFSVVNSLGVIDLTYVVNYIQQMETVIEAGVWTGGWFRKYRGGWVEQGGNITISSNSSNLNTTFTLFVPYANTDYSVLLQRTSNINTAGDVAPPLVRSKTTTTFVFSAMSTSLSWRAFGMGVVS